MTAKAWSPAELEPAVGAAAAAAAAVLAPPNFERPNSRQKLLMSEAKDER